MTDAETGPGRGQARRPWYLYVVECADGTLYTGISTDVARRVRQHNAGRGSRYTRTRRPVALRGAWRFAGHRAALLAEIALKRRGQPDKKRLIAAGADYRAGEWVATHPSKAQERG